MSDKDALPPQAMPPNPKQAYGDRKVPIHLFPMPAVALGAMGFLEGKLKYGQDNFRGLPVEAMTYVRAALSHINHYAEGEWAPIDSDPDESPVPHLGLALASIAILVDAHYAKSLIDNRKYPGGYGKAIAEMMPLVQALNDKFGHLRPKHYTVADAERNTEKVLDTATVLDDVSIRHIDNKPPEDEDTMAGTAKKPASKAKAKAKKPAKKIKSSTAAKSSR